jgi:hypothetical protein
VDLSWHNILLILFRTNSQILMAGVAITAFSLLLYAFSFNLRDRVARSFTIILMCVVIVFTAESIGSTRTLAWEIELCQRLQWVGVIFLPPAYMHFSDALLATTGKVSRWRRRWLVRVMYLVSGAFLLLLPTPLFLGAIVMDRQPAPQLTRTLLTNLFTLYYIASMIVSWINFARAYQRTTTRASQRRMTYLITGALAPAMGSFPYLLFGSDIAANYPLLFWGVVMFSNVLIGGMVVVMAYAVAFFGVAWSDRLVKSRLFKWIMRGPVTASITLGMVTIVRRFGEWFGFSYTALVPIVMVGTILLIEYFITLFSPIWERWFFYGSDRTNLELLQRLEDRLLTRNDLSQFLEMVLAAVSDRLQSEGAYVVALNSEGLELVVTVGKTRFDQQGTPDDLLEVVTRHGGNGDFFQWGDDTIVPLEDEVQPGEKRMLGLMGVAGHAGKGLDIDQKQAIHVLSGRATMALRDRKLEAQIFQSMRTLTSEVDLIQRLRAAARYDRNKILLSEESLPDDDMSQWVKEALTHYWGGPKLTESPLMQLKVVQANLGAHDGNQANALRSILRQAVEQVRPEGERRFTAEWILYNILEMKFMEGRKVREVAMRLAMSEADLYRKQRVAIEAVAKGIVEMEAQINYSNDR